MDETVHRAGKLRACKIRYKDGVGCTIWTPMKDDDQDDSPGICFDFPGDELENFRILAHQLIEAEPDEYVEDPEEAERERKWKEKTSKLSYKILDWLSDFSVSLTPFEWAFTTLWLSTTRPSNHGKLLAHVCCHGFRFGPLTVTWPKR